jgi:hypothetical protein
LQKYIIVEKTKPLSKEERFVCEMIWGGVPVDVVWVRQLFIKI